MSDRYTGPATATLSAIAAEVLAARRKFPSRHHRLAALTEEVGELAQALLKGGNGIAARQEAIQVACCAIRIIEEGDADFDDTRYGPTNRPRPKPAGIADVLEWHCAACGATYPVDTEDELHGYVLGSKERCECDGGTLVVRKTGHKTDVDAITHAIAALRHAALVNTKQDSETVSGMLRAADAATTALGRIGRAR